MKHLDEELKLIENCLKAIEEKINWGLHSSEWQNRHFEKLSDLFYQEKKIRISTTTLKRLWGKVNAKNRFRESTLDQLVQFIDYKNWLEYKSKEAKILTNQDETIIVKKKPPLIKKRVLISVFLLLFVLLGVVYLLPKEDYSSVVFRIEKTQKKVPCTIKIYYDVSKIKTDSIFLINRIGDRMYKQTLAKENHYHYSMLKDVKFHRFMLIIGNDTVATKQVSPQTTGWQAVVTRSDADFMYFNEDSLMSDSVLSPPDFLYKRYSMYNKKFSFNFYNFHNYNVDGNNFTFKTRLKYTPVEGQFACRETNVSIVDNTEKRIDVPLFNQGCAIKGWLALSEKTFKGKKYNLTKFSIDTVWSDLEIRNKNKYVKIYLNNRLIFEDFYEKSIGRIHGIRIWFRGLGKIDYVRLYNENEKLTYEFD